MKTEYSSNDTQTIKLRAYELTAGPECSIGAFVKCAWFGGLYLSSVFVLTSIGICVRWVLNSI